MNNSVPNSFLFIKRLIKISKLVCLMASKLLEEIDQRFNSIIGSTFRQISRVHVEGKFFYSTYQIIYFLLQTVICWIC